MKPSLDSLSAAVQVLLIRELQHLHSKSNTSALFLRSLPEKMLENVELSSAQKVL